MAAVGAARTLGDLRAALAAWRASGGVAAAAKEHGNVVHETLLPGDDHTAVMDVLPPPELHLLIGVVNSLLSGN